MHKRDTATFEIRIRNAEGVPVVALAGDLTKAMAKTVATTVSELSKAGHYNIIINIEKVNATSWKMMRGLSRAAKGVAKHYGAVSIVSDKDHILDMLRACGLGRIFRLAKSENHAISHIKHLDRRPDGVRVIDARLMEKL